MSNADIELIKQWLASEGRVEGDHLIVPNDFFTRLNAALNKREDNTGFLDAIIEKLAKP